MTVEGQSAVLDPPVIERTRETRVETRVDRCGEAKLFMRWQRNHDGAARDALITRFSPLSRRLARRYRHTSEPYEDLCQVAQIGLVKAIDGYDPGRGFPFTAYAVPTILGELRRHFRSSSWAVHVPRAIQERAIEVRDAERALTDEQGRSPTVGEMAQFIGLSVEETLDAMQAIRALGSVSLDAPRGGENGEQESTYAEAVGAEDSGYELVELGTDLNSALQLLAPKQREVLRLRFFEELTQTQIAERIGVSQMQVSRVLARCLAELRERIGEPALLHGAG
ncbi:MAG TPA: SigB/SigF/SigG family RNA polymerase sigma factor [Solirubrobacteraceae bacterium]|jgi:RNA polymerase sigma-B factor